MFAVVKVIPEHILNAHSTAMGTYQRHPVCRLLFTSCPPYIAPLIVSQRIYSIHRVLWRRFFPELLTKLFKTIKPKLNAFVVFVMLGAIPASPYSTRIVYVRGVVDYQLIGSFFRPPSTFHSARPTL